MSNKENTNRTQPNQILDTFICACQCSLSGTKQATHKIPRSFNGRFFFFTKSIDMLSDEYSAFTAKLEAAQEAQKWLPRCQDSHLTLIGGERSWGQRSLFTCCSFPPHYLQSLIPAMSNTPSLKGWSILLNVNTKLGSFSTRRCHRLGLMFYHRVGFCWAGSFSGCSDCRGEHFGYCFGHI